MLWRQTTQTKEGREGKPLLFTALLQGAATGRKQVVSFLYGKAEGTARMKALRWDTRKPNEASALREGRGENRRREGGTKQNKVRNFGFHSA